MRRLIACSSHFPLMYSSLFALQASAMSTETQIKLFAIAESSGQYQSNRHVSPEWKETLILTISLPPFSSGERGTHHSIVEAQFTTQQRLQSHETTLVLVSISIIMSYRRAIPYSHTPTKARWTRISFPQDRRVSAYSNIAKIGHHREQLFLPLQADEDGAYPSRTAAQSRTHTTTCSCQDLRYCVGSQDEADGLSYSREYKTQCIPLFANEV